MLQVLSEVADACGATPGQTALYWVLNRPGIIGATTVAQLVENFGAQDLDISAEHLGDLERASAWTDDRTLLARPQSARTVDA